MAHSLVEERSGFEDRSVAGDVIRAQSLATLEDEHAVQFLEAHGIRGKETRRLNRGKRWRRPPGRRSGVAALLPRSRRRQTAGKRCEQKQTTTPKTTTQRHQSISPTVERTLATGFCTCCEKKKKKCFPPAAAAAAVVASGFEFRAIIVARSFQPLSDCLLRLSERVRHTCSHNGSPFLLFIYHSNRDRV